MNTNDRQDMNRDPITGAPGSHPLGTGVGATGGALAGAAIGSIFGPIGTLVGGAIGAAGGGAAGHSVAERVDPTADWRAPFLPRAHCSRWTAFTFATHRSSRRMCCAPGHGRVCQTTARCLPKSVSECIACRVHARTARRRTHAVNACVGKVQASVRADQWRQT